MQDPGRHDEDGNVGDQHHANRSVRIFRPVDAFPRECFVPELRDGGTLEGADEGGDDSEEAVDGEDGPERDVDAAVGGTEFEEGDDEGGFDETEDGIIDYCVCKAPFLVEDFVDGVWGDVPVMVSVPREFES